MTWKATQRAWLQEGRAQEIKLPGGLSLVFLALLSLQRWAFTTAKIGQAFVFLRSYGTVRRELQRVEAVLDLRPGDWHRDRSMRPRSGRQRRYCCRKLVVSKIVEKYLPVRFALLILIRKRSGLSLAIWLQTSRANTSCAPASESRRDSSASLTTADTAAPFSVWAAMD
jgi:hypothetical protein